MAETGQKSRSFGLRVLDFVLLAVGALIAVLVALWIVHIVFGILAFAFKVVVVVAVVAAAVWLFRLLTRRR
jgi:hypothetical protein